MRERIIFEKEFVLLGKQEWLFLCVFLTGLKFYKDCEKKKSDNIDIDYIHKLPSLSSFFRAESSQQIIVYVCEYVGLDKVS